MQDTWYGDRRDLVKWGGLVHLAFREGISNIVQVAFLRSGPRPVLEVDGQPVEIAEQVWTHFRDVTLIKGLGDKAGLKDLKIFVVDRLFVPGERDQYVQHAATVIASRPAPRIVLLDPDTGIEPKNASAKHVKKEDVKYIWQALGPGDWLVLYQHASRKKGWKAKTKAKFQRACGANGATTIEGPRLASDVAFFAVKKE